MKTSAFLFYLGLGVCMFPFGIWAQTDYQGITTPPKEETPVVTQPVEEPIPTEPIVTQPVTQTDTTTTTTTNTTSPTLTPEQIRKIKERYQETQIPETSDREEVVVTDTGSESGETLVGGGGGYFEPFREVYQEVLITYYDEIQTQVLTQDEVRIFLEEYLLDHKDEIVSAQQGGNFNTGKLLQSFRQELKKVVREKKREKMGSGMVAKINKRMDRMMEYVEDNNENVMNFSSKVMSMQNVSKNPFSLLVNIILALLYLLTFLYCTYVINEYRSDVWGDWKKTLGWNRVQSSYLSWHASRNSWFDRIPSVFRLLFSFVQFVISLTIIGVILSFIDPEYTVFSARSIVFAGFIILVVAGSALLKDLSLYLVGRMFFGKKYRFVFFSTGYVLATLSVLVNRIAGLVPSFVFGAFAGVQSRHDKDEEQGSGLLLVAVGFSLIVGLGLRFLTEWAQGAMLVLLIGAVYGIMNDLFRALLPLKNFWGRSLYRDYPVIRFMLFAFILFAFFHLLFNPHGDLRQVAQGLNDNFWRMIVNLLVIVVITFVFRLYARKIHGMMYMKK